MRGLLQGLRFASKVVFAPCSRCVPSLSASGLEVGRPRQPRCLTPCQHYGRPAVCKDVQRITWIVLLDAGWTGWAHSLDRATRGNPWCKPRNTKVRWKDAPRGKARKRVRESQGGGEATRTIAALRLEAFRTLPCTVASPGCLLGQAREEGQYSCSSPPCTRPWYVFRARGSMPPRCPLALYRFPRPPPF